MLKVLALDWIVVVGAALDWIVVVAAALVQGSCSGLDRDCRC